MKININQKKSYNEIELSNNQITVKCIDLGATITEIITPDKNGNLENVVLSYDDLDTYLKNPAYLGTLVGRTGGRIGDAKINIEGVEYKLDKNNGENTLHGGFDGFSFKKFDFETFENENEVGVKFKLISKDNECGFPGEVVGDILYTLNNLNEFKISYIAKTNKTTILNLTNHTYFNLSGNVKRKIYNHNLLINSSKIAELNQNSIVTGKMINVENTPFDFRKSKLVGQDIEKDDVQLNLAKGYDHYFELDEKKIELSEEESGRKLTVTTNCDGVVFYSLNFISEGKLSTQKDLDYRDALCLETQNLPIGYDNLFIEKSLLKPNEVYKKETTYKFGLI